MAAARLGFGPYDKCFTSLPPDNCSNYLARLSYLCSISGNNNFNYIDNNLHNRFYIHIDLCSQPLQSGI